HRGRRGAPMARRDDREYRAIFEGGATQPAGMHRRPNAAGLSPRAVKRLLFRDFRAFVFFVVQTRESQMNTPGARGKTTGPINVAELIDNSRVGALQISTFAICLLCLIMDGFDVQALGYVAPEIVRGWQIANAALGPVFGAGNFGVLVGSLVFSMLADKVGRRPVLIGATVFFGVMTIVAARANAVGEPLVVRFIAGIGLGCIIPNATALVGEYSPRRLRGPLMMIVGGVGFT